MFKNIRYLKLVFLTPFVFFSLFCHRYFSYEHFYVIYCKFWELDADHDFLIDKENLIRYGNHALTYRIVDRIFTQVCDAPIFLLFFSPNYLLSTKAEIIFVLYVCSQSSLIVLIYLLDWFLSLWFVRFQEGLLVKLKEKWDMKILFTLYSQRRINHLSPVLSIGMYMYLSSVFLNVKFLPSLDSAISLS